MNLILEPLSSVAGVEIKGYDPRQPLRDVEREIIENAFREHYLILIRGKELSGVDQIDLSEIVGPVSRRRMPEKEKVMHISNVHKDGALPDGEIYFHCDHSMFEHPLKAISLYAEIVPAVGGDTLFANEALAYTMLPSQLKNRITNLRALHIKDYRVTQGYNQGNVRSKGTLPGADAPHWIHPVVWTHPENGKPILFVNRLLTDSIVGLPEAESEALLEELFFYTEHPDIIYRHHWRDQDYVLWDNRLFQHARTNFDPSEKRALRRVPIGERSEQAATALLNQTVSS